MQTNRLVVALCVCICLTGYTTYKLDKMKRIDRADGVSERVVRKTLEHAKRADVCYLWTTEKTQADCDYWQSVNVGDTIEVVTVEGDRYVKGGDVYTSDGNYAFDAALLVAEIIGVLVCAALLIRRARAHRRRDSRA